MVRCRHFHFVSYHSIYFLSISSQVFPSFLASFVASSILLFQIPTQTWCSWKDSWDSSRRSTWTFTPLTLWYSTGSLERQSRDSGPERSTATDFFLSGYFSYLFRTFSTFYTWCYRQFNSYQIKKHRITTSIFSNKALLVISLYIVHGAMCDWFLHLLLFFKPRIKVDSKYNQLSVGVLGPLKSCVLAAYNS